MLKLLVVAPSWVGDLVMSQPLLAELKKRFPESSLSLLAPPWSASLVERIPAVDAFIAMPFGHGILDLKGRYQFAQNIRKEHFEQAWVLPNSLKSALIPFLAKIPKRTGFVGEWRYGLLNDIRTLKVKAIPRLVDRYFSLAFSKEEQVPKAPAPVLKTKPEEVQGALSAFHLKVDQPILALAPGAEFGPSKRWPEPYYAQVAQHYLSKGWQVWILGAGKDTPVAKEIQKLCQEKCIDLTGRTTLAQAIDLIAKVTAVVTNDSGLMHIASAVEKPLIAVYGSTDPGYTPPLGANAHIVRTAISCSPCFQRECPLKHHRCMKELLPELVIEQLEQKVVV